MSAAGQAFSDPDGDTLKYELSWSMPSPPAGVSLVGTHVKGVPTEVGSFTAGVTVRDGRGGELLYLVIFDVAANSPPVLAHPNDVQVTSVGATLDYDATQAGTTFSADAEGDAITYQVSILSPAPGLATNGTRITGRFDTPGAARVRIVASDPFGATSEDEFIVAAAAPDPGRPSLPQVSYVYDDAKLPLPPKFRLSRELIIPFWDTTPVDNPTTDAGATLGRVLFYDKRLSATNTHSCGSCHEQSHGFANAARFSVGATGETTKRNAMGLTEVRYNINDAFFSDLRASTLEKLALMPIQDHLELGNSLTKLVPKLSATDFYPPLFAAAFGTTEVNKDRIAKALAQFLRSLISYNAKIDRIENPPAGEDPADPATVYTPQEQAGSDVFATSQCFFCHGDSLRNSNHPENNGIDDVVTDPGSGNGRFRPASLRNVARTAPYMHDGRFATLRDVVEHYDHGVKDSPNLGAVLRENLLGPVRRLNLSEADKEALVAFLGTFTDEQFLSDPRFSDPFQ